MRRLVRRMETEDIERKVDGLLKAPPSWGTEKMLGLLVDELARRAEEDGGDGDR